VGEQEFLVSNLSIQVNSILPPPSKQVPENGEATASTSAPTPFPIFDPVKVEAPWWWWVMWGVLIYCHCGVCDT